MNNPLPVNKYCWGWKFRDLDSKICMIKNPETVGSGWGYNGEQILVS
jgi:hypothetical protein